MLLLEVISKNIRDTFGRRLDVQCYTDLRSLGIIPPPSQRLHGFINMLRTRVTPSLHYFTLCRVFLWKTNKPQIAVIWLNTFTEEYATCNHRTETTEILKLVLTGVSRWSKPSVGIFKLLLILSQQALQVQQITVEAGNRSVNCDGGLQQTVWVILFFLWRRLTHFPTCLVVPDLTLVTCTLYLVSALKGRFRRDNISVGYCSFWSASVLHTHIYSVSVMRLRAGFVLQL